MHRVLYNHNLFSHVATMIGSEQSAGELQKKVLAKVGTITDVVASIGGFAFTSPLLQQSVEELKKVGKYQFIRKMFSTINNVIRIYFLQKAIGIIKFIL